MTKATENTIVEALPVVEASKRDFMEEVTTALTGTWFQTKRTASDSVVLAAEATELTLKASATVVEGGIVLVRAAKEVLPGSLDELLEDIRLLAADNTDAPEKEAEPS